jgi:hypothetical protein
MSWISPGTTVGLAVFADTQAVTMSTVRARIRSDAGIAVSFGPIQAFPGRAFNFAIIL